MMIEPHHSLVEQSPDAIFLVQKSRVVFLNGAAVRLLGASGPDQVIGRQLPGLFRPEDGSRLHEDLERWAAGETAQRIEAKIVRLDGSVVDVEVVGGAIEGAG